LLKKTINKKLVFFFTVLYVIMSIFVAYPIYVGNPNLEFVIKLVTLFSLSFLYLESTTKVNYWYVLILLFSILSDSLFVFADNFLFEALFLLITNRFLYLIIIHPSILKYSVKKIIFYAVPFVFTFGMIYLVLYEYVQEIQLSVFILGVLSIVVLLFSFIDLLNKNSKKTLYFFIGVLILPIADILTAIANYIDEHFSYIVIYHYMYYVARFMILKSMLLRK